VDFIKREYIYNKLNIETTNQLSIYSNNEKDYILLNKKNIIFYTENNDLYNKYQNIYFRLPRVINNFSNYKDEQLLTNDIGSIKKYIKNNNLITDIYSNVTNIYTLAYLLEMGIKKVALSPELTIEECYKLYNNFIHNFNYIPNIEIFIYGRVELMIIKHCILKNNINKNSICNICKNNNNNYELLDRNNKKYPIITRNCNNIILNCSITDYLDKIVKKEGINYSISLNKINDKNKINKFIKEW